MTKGEMKDKALNGGLRKIKCAKRPCLSGEHYPPNNIYIDPGTYEYICPSCGERTEFTVPLVTC